MVMITVVLVVNPLIKLALSVTLVIGTVLVNTQLSRNILIITVIPQIRQRELCQRGHNGKNKYAYNPPFKHEALSYANYICFKKPLRHGTPSNLWPKNMFVNAINTFHFVLTK